jgi:ADP-ribosylglycohydrolase
MRAHPIGIALSSNPKLAFQLGMESGAITHGDPDGYVPAGALAMLIALLVSGLSMQEGIRAVVQEVQRLGKKTATGTLTAIKQALDAPTSGDLGLKIDSLIGRTGKYPGGWMGHDALAIALYAVRCAPNDPIEATKIAVNHSGDSDSTGSIAGAIMGATYGPNAFYSELKRSRIKLEHRSSLERLARRLWETSGRVDATDFSWVDLRLWLKRTPSNWRSKF